MKKKGFTLVELLAVIVILAIIAVIATPIILGVIEKSKKGAVENSALGYTEAVEKQIARNLLDEDATNDITDGVYTVNDLTSKRVKVKGDTPSEGWVKIEKKQVVSYSLKIGNYVVTYNKENENTETTKNGEIAQKPIIYHYDYGTPTTSSTTDYTTLGKKVFAFLGSDDSHGVCINDGELFCIKANEYQTTEERIKAHVVESRCYGSDGYYVDCNSGTFRCGASSEGIVSCRACSPGDVYCTASSTDGGCNVSADGSFNCD